MQLRRMAPVVVLGAFTLTACQDKQARQDIAALKEWLGTSSSPVVKPDHTVHQWHLSVYKAICNLEYKAMPDETDRLCKTADPEHGGPPNPPPWGL